MALFGSKRSAQELLAASDWDSPAARDAMLGELRSAPPPSRQLLPLLWSTDPAVRQTAIALFKARPEARALHELLAHFGHHPPQARQALAPMLAELPEGKVAAALDGLLESAQPDERDGTWEVVPSLPVGLRERYVERALGEAPPATRVKILEELAGGERLESHLHAVLATADAEDLRVRRAAVAALDAVDRPEVLPVMVERLGDGDERVRSRADAYLRRATREQPEAIRQAMGRMLTRGSDDARRAAIALLLECGEPREIVPRVLELCNGMAGWLRSRVIESLCAAGDPVLEVGLELMAREDSPARTGAIMMLAEGFEDRRLVEPFCRLLGDPDWWLRVTACQVLGKLGDTRAVPALVRMLEDEDTRWAAVDALAQIREPASLKPVSRLLRDPRAEVRQEVLQAFSRFDDLRLLPVLVSVRDKDPDPEVRMRAADVLRNMSRRLNVATSEGKHDPRRLTNPLDKLLLRIREMGASDLHLSVGEPPLVRVDGVLRRMQGVGRLEAKHTRAYIESILDDEQRRRLHEEGGLDFSHVTEGVGRYRANAYVQRLGICASFRVVPQAPPTFEELRLPPQLKELLDYHQGVIVISGPAGSGKSTTLNALVNLINDTKPLHVITLEDPIEFIHPVKVALVNQRQVGRDTRDFTRGLRAALREDPDVIIVGELRDAETMGLALKAAETGHLVIATLHTTSAVQTIDRLVDSFPPEEQAQIRTSLSESLKYVACQRLLPRADGKGRVALFEIIKGTLSIGNKIRKNETFLIPGLMQIGRQLGMRTRDQALEELLEDGLISARTAYETAEKPSIFAERAAAQSETAEAAR